MALTKKIIIVILLCVAGLVVFYFISAARSLQNNHIAFLDIGQGDATLIRFDDGSTMLIDCAENSIILRALSRQLPFWERELDYLVITHTDRDHFGGCVDVFEQYEVHTVVTNGRTTDDAWWSAVQNAVQNEHAHTMVIDHQQLWHFASSSIFFLFPDHTVSAEEIKKDNNSSIVMRVSGTQETVLLMADAEVELERYLVEQFGPWLQSSLLKAGHHGSNSSSSDVLLDVVQPRVAIISSGAGNRFGHPHLRVLSRLKRKGIEVRRTDLEGDIVVGF